MKKTPIVAGENLPLFLVRTPDGVRTGCEGKSLQHVGVPIRSVAASALGCLRSLDTAVPSTR